MPKPAIVILALITLGLAIPAPARADFDAAADFSSSSNPNGVWSYGYSTTLGGTFNLYTENGDFPNPNGSLTGLDYWGQNIGLHNPAVIHNGTGSTILINGTATYQPGQLGLHPGPDGEDSIVRFTVSTAATYSLSSSFAGIDTVGTTTDVYVLLNGASLFDGLINGFGANASYSQTLALASGDEVDFVVGYGTNHTYFFDSTGLAAHLRAVPEPTSMLSLGLGWASIAGYAGRRRVRSRAIKRA